LTTIGKPPVNRRLAALSFRLVELEDMAEITVAVIVFPDAAKLGSLDVGFALFALLLLFVLVVGETSSVEELFVCGETDRVDEKLAGFVFLLLLLFELIWLLHIP
jgi:hypothetical protein